MKPSVNLRSTFFGAVMAAVAGGALIASVSYGQAPQVSRDVTGVWIDNTGQGAVEIAPCADSLCGRIVWLKEPADKSGRPLADGYNPDARLRQRPICGLPIIGGVKRISDTTWDAGWIYDPKQGKQFDVEIKLRSPERLQVMGYLGVKFLSETFVWTRAPATLPKCTTTQAAPAAAPSPPAAAARMK